LAANRGKQPAKNLGLLRVMLDIIKQDNNLSQSFHHENSSGKFICTNDLDAKGTKDQIICQGRVRSADRLLFKPKDRVDFAAAPPTAGSNGLSGAVSGLSAHFTAGSSQLMHCRSVRPEMVITGTVRFPHFGQRV
jgi:hypothetical protein